MMDCRYCFQDSHTILDQEYLYRPRVSKMDFIHRRKFLRIVKHGMGCFVKGVKNSIQCFVQGVLKWHAIVCSGYQKWHRMFCPGGQK